METEQILAKIERFIRLKSIGETTFGLKAVGDRNLVPQLRDGRELRRKTRERIVVFMRDYEPQ